MPGTTLRASQEDWSHPTLETPESHELSLNAPRETSMKAVLIRLVACGALIAVACLILVTRHRKSSVPTLQPSGIELGLRESATSPSSEPRQEPAAAEHSTRIVPSTTEVVDNTTYVLRGVVRISNAPRWTPHGLIEVTYDEPYKMPRDYIATDTLEENGTFDVDISELVIAKARRFRRSPGLGRFKVRVDGEFFLPAEATVDLSSASLKTSEDGSTKSESWVELVTTLGSRLAGRVVFEDQRPVPDAEVFAVTMGPQSEYEAVSHTSTGDRGEFLLQASCDQQLAILALRKGFKPAVAVVLPTPGEMVQLGAIILHDGVAISGQLETSQLDDQYMITARRPGNGVIRYYVVSNDYMGIQWCGVNAYWGVIGSTVAGGEFTLNGLEPGDYLVWVGRNGRAECTVAGVTSNSRNLTAPSIGVVLRDLAPRVTLHVLAEGQPVIGATVTITDGGSQCTVNTGEGGIVDLVLRPGEAFGVTITADSFLTYTTTLTAPLEGESVTETASLER